MRIELDIGALEKTLKDLEKVARDIKSKQVEVGIIDGDSELQMKAHVNEYGATITVTPKMRAWFAYQGYPLKASTTTITIPERSFMRTGQKKAAPKVKAKAETLLPQVVKASIPVETFLEAIGDEFAGKIQEHTRSISSPANAGFTAERKGSSNPLIDTGHLISKIESKVK